MGVDGGRDQDENAVTPDRSADKPQPDHQSPHIEAHPFGCVQFILGRGQIMCVGAGGRLFALIT